MKKLVFSLVVGLLFVFTACNDDDGYSLGQYWVGFGVVSDVDSYKIVLDDGEVLYAIAFPAGHPGEDHEFKNGDRVYVNFTILGDKTNEAGDVVAYNVKINSLKSVLTKGILNITEEIEDSIGNDPIIVKEWWVANDMLNFQLKYYGRYQTHFINLVKQSGDLSLENQPFELELRHNANDDSEDIPYTAFVSFNLDSLQVAGADSIRFKVKHTNYHEESIEFEGVYKYGENN
jgi:hypothetical protein